MGCAIGEVSKKKKKEKKKKKKRKKKRKKKKNLVFIKRLDLDGRYSQRGETR